MKKIIFIIKLILDSFRDTKKITKYFNLVKLNGYEVILKIFFIRLFYSIENIRSKQKIHLINEITDNSFLEGEKFDTDQISKEIDKRGYSKIFKINNSLIKRITDQIFKSTNIDVKIDNIEKSKILKNENEEINDYFFRLKEKKISRITGTINLHNNKLFQEFLLSNSMINLVKSYLNTNNFSVNASFFISNPLEISEEEKYKNAQYFHWDNDFRKFFKLYLYLTDVDENSGPHIFIPGTHKKKRADHKLCRLYSDSQIYSSYEKSQKFLGKAGSLFFVDSYGLHKGETPKSNSRLLLNVHFGKGKILYSKDDFYFKGD
jgi:ectoine hydroxylase-related dioxygenase (phytanoyl-CoA dioxygenase family)